MLFHVKLNGKWLGRGRQGEIEYLSTPAGAVLFGGEEWQTRWLRTKGAELVYYCPVCEETLLVPGQTVCLACGVDITQELIESGLFYLTGRWHREHQNG